MLNRLLPTNPAKEEFILDLLKALADPEKARERAEQLIKLRDEANIAIREAASKLEAIRSGDTELTKREDVLVKQRNSFEEDIKVRQQSLSEKQQEFKKHLEEFERSRKEVELNLEQRVAEVEKSVVLNAQKFSELVEREAEVNKLQLAAELAMTEAKKLQGQYEKKVTALRSAGVAF